MKKNAQAATTIATEIEAWLRGSMAFVNSMVTKFIVLQNRRLVKWLYGSFVTKRQGKIL